MMNLDSETVYDLIFKAYKEKVTERLWHLYSCAFPHMDPEKRISFDEFIEPLTNPKEPESADDILKNIKGMMDDFTPERR